ncbi:MAG: PAS domain S-box protein [Cyanosarcina radialis HA8281-LM2]|jgi:PAS domain S-box-containing protein|nr:PAS domain S-box protein [Cyanosarcina radialis HA8281-LM2]
MAIPPPLLLVEDDSADAVALAEMLSQKDDRSWEVLRVKRLSEALDRIESSRFSAVLLDLSLAGDRGLDAIARIKAVARYLPIVVLTELDDRELALQAVAAGAQDYLIKGSINPETLLRVIRYAIERERILQQLQAEILERERSEQILRSIVEGTASVTGKDFFHSLVRSLAQALEARYAFISECLDSPPTKVRAFAFWQGNNFGDNFEYNLHGSPCEQVINSGRCQYYPRQIQSLFPEEEGLVDWEAQSYAGITLKDSSGKILGHLAVLDDRPMENEVRTRSILEIFAARAATEIERQLAEEALQISEEKFSKAFRSSPNAITLSTLKDGCYIDINDSCLKMLGYSREEMLGRSTLDLGIWAKPEDRDRLTQPIEERGAVSNLEFLFRKKSGEVFPGLLSAEVIQLEEEPCLLAVTTDITALKQAEKMLERLAEIGELAATIVHEVRNPLTTVMMGLTSLKRAKLSDRFSEHLALALDEAERLQRLLNQILLYAKPQNLDRSQFDLYSSTSETIDCLRSLPLAIGKKLEFISSAVPIEVSADKDKLKQVVINLVTNALEAVDAGEVVTVKLQLESEDRRIYLEVHNGGAPIPSEILPKLTKPFFTTKPTGNGLGLAIVKRIVEAHGGELQIESSALAGTTVTVELPAIS